MRVSASLAFLFVFGIQHFFPSFVIAASNADVVQKAYFLSQQSKVSAVDVYELIRTVQESSLIDPQGKLSPLLQVVIYDLEPKMREQGADSLTYQVFQGFVGSVGGKLKGRQHQPIKHKSVWHELDQKYFKYQSHQEMPDQVDYLVVGAGISGTAIAHYLRQMAGPKAVIVVVDANFPAAGASGLNGGNHQAFPESFHGQSEYLELERYKFLKETRPHLSEVALRKMAREQAIIVMKWGQANGKRFQRINELIIRRDLQKALAAGLSVDPSKLGADVSYSGWLRMADFVHDEAGFAHDKALALELGIPIEIWSAEKIGHELQIPTARPGRRVPGSGNYHPVKLIEKLFDVLIDQGVQLYTQTRVTKIDPLGSSTLNPVRVLYERGGKAKSVLVGKVVVATDAYSSQLVPQVRGIIDPYVSQVSSYKYVQDHMKGMTITSADGDFYLNIMASSKFKGYGTAVVGGGPDRYIENPERAKFNVEAFDWVNNRFFEIFPEMKGRIADSVWWGAFGFTDDRLPVLSYLHAKDNRVVFWGGTQGYGGSWCFQGAYLAAMMATEKDPNVVRRNLARYAPAEHFSLERFHKRPSVANCSGRSSK